MTDQKSPIQPIAGRGATGNTPNRFEKLQLDPTQADEILDPESQPGRPVTRFLEDRSRTILTSNQSPDIPFDFSVNPYRGCEHGCIYCYARPTHEYLGFSAGIEFETRIIVKRDAPELLREKLQSRSWKPACITLSGVTDCYQPIERKLQLTRRCLEVLRDFRNPFTVITKNHLVTRDKDLLGEMAAARAAGAFLTITTLDTDLCSILEPRTSRPAHRLEAIRELAEAGVPVGVMIAPVIPGLTDHEMPAILAAAREAGARFAGYVPLRLPLAVLPLFSEWLEVHFPDRREKILNRIRSMKDGKLNVSEFGTRMRGTGLFADQLSSMFRLYCRREGLNDGEMELSTDGFRRPGEQMRLF